uniref:Bax inhibitor 1 n=1 Tax=Parascaris univalens TaxID=6257 RepID=A0A915BPV5_PARUN
ANQSNCSMQMMRVSELFLPRSWTLAEEVMSTDARRRPATGRDVLRNIQNVFTSLNDKLWVAFCRSVRSLNVLLEEFGIKFARLSHARNGCCKNFS